MSNRKRRGRSEGSVFKRGDGIWVASKSCGHDAAGKRKRRTCYGATKTEAMDALKALINGNAKPLGDADRLTVGEYLDRWLELVKPKLCPTTHQRYEQHIRLHLNPHVGHLLLRKLEAFHVDQLYQKMEVDGDSAAERLKTGKAFGTALRHAVRTHLIPHNPVSDIPKPKVDKKEIHPLDGERARALLEATCTDRLAALYVLALDSGMRQGELFGLQWLDLDFDAGTIQVQRSLEEIKGHLRLKELKTKASKRRIVLSPFALDAMSKHRKQMLKEGHIDGPVFCDSDGGFLRKSNFARRSFKPAIRRANEAAKKAAAKQDASGKKLVTPHLLPDIRFHDLRHTCATLLLMADENVKVVQERLGHAKIQVTLDTYSHVLPGMQKRAAEKLDALWKQPGAKASAGQRG